MLVFAVVEGQGDHLVNGDDARVAQGCWEEFAEPFEGALEALVFLGAFVDDDGGGVRGQKVVIAPLALLLDREGDAWEEGGRGGRS